MSRAPLEIEIVKGNTSSRVPDIGIQGSIHKKLKNALHRIRYVQHGSAKQPVNVLQTNAKNKLQLPSDLASKLGLLPGARIRMKVKPRSHTLSLGPLLGVMVSRYREKNSERPFANTTSFCKEITEAGQRAHASVFFFTPQDIQKSSTCIRGHVYHQGAWHTRTFPIPHVIYNRLTSRKYENLTHVQKFIQSVKTQYNTQVFNERYLNKSEVFRALRKEQGLHVYLPESHSFSTPVVLKNMVHKHELLFLKPITGSLGKGIIKIRKIGNQQFECQLSQKEGVRNQRYSSLHSLLKALGPKSKKQNYQLQQGLHLLTINQRPLDFRALVQRDDQGKWDITSIVARIASQQHFVSNLARGGSLSTVSAALAKSSLASKKTFIASKLRQATLAIAKGIENQIDSHFGELGIDLGVDKNGKIWLIEVNSKPSKDDDTPLQTEVKIRPSVKNVIKYMHYLARF